MIVAHVDSKTGPDVFYRLRDLKRGDTINVTDSAGVDHTFTVRRTETDGKHDLPYDEIWSETHAAVLRLITCAGEYDHDAGAYEDNLIVFAR